METKRNKYTLAGPAVLRVLFICITSLKDGIMEPLCTGVGYLLILIQTRVSVVGTGICNELKDYGNLEDALWEDEELKIQTVQLTEDNNRLQVEQFELDRLRKLYELDQDYMQYDKVGTRVTARGSEKWFQVFCVNKGSAGEAAVDMNVVADGDLMGTVMDVDADYVTARSIADDSNRVDATKLDSSYNCIVARDLTLYEEGRLKLMDFPKNAVLGDGDQIVTSNVSTKFLPGILVGYVANISIDPDHLIQSGYLTPVADFSNLREMLIITDIKDTREAAAQWLKRR